MFNFKDMAGKKTPEDSKISSQPLGQEMPNVKGGSEGGIGGYNTGLLSSVGNAAFGGKNGAPPNPFADFDPESYVGANLQANKGGMEGLAKLIGSVLSMGGKGGK